MKKLQLLSLFFVVLGLGCNEIPPEIPPFEAPTGDRVVVLEEFTGVKCANCPQAATQIENLKALYGDRFIAITMHSFKFGNLGAPFDDSNYDFRTEDGDDLVDILGGASFIPVGGIDRDEFGGNTLVSFTNWSSRVEEAIEKDAPVSLTIDHSFNEETREINIKVSSYIQDFTEGNLLLHLGLTEDGIVDPQLNGSEKELEYVHNHILRDYISNVTGDNLGTNVEIDKIVEKTYSYTLPPEQGWWKAENINIFAFITRDGEETLQGAKVKLMPQ